MDAAVTYAGLFEWIDRDPSPWRVGLAMDTLNYDGGPYVAAEIVRRYDLDASVAFDTMYKALGPDFGEVQSPDAVDSKIPRSYIALYDALEARWRSGKFRKQQFGLPELERNAETVPVLEATADSIGFKVSRPGGIYSIVRELKITRGLPPMDDEEALGESDMHALWAVSDS